MDAQGILPVVSRKNFQDKTITLDGTRWEGCRFIGCSLFYNGGLAEISKCYFFGTKIFLNDQVAYVLNVAKSLGWLISPPSA